MPIDFKSFPLREFRRSRELDWDPFAIDYTQDAKDWLELSAVEQDFLLRQVSGFLVGERGVTHDLAPLQQVLRYEKGRMEEEMYLTVQLYEESRHIEFFQLWLNEALPGVYGRDIPYVDIMYDPDEDYILTKRMPRVFRQLYKDASPAQQMRAAVIYHMIIEGVTAEVGYKIFYGMLDRDGIMPALRQGVKLIQRDESRHVAFGTYFIQRLIVENPELGELFESEMQDLREPAQKGIDQIFDAAGDEEPFGLTREPFHKLTDEFWHGRIQAVKRGALVRA